MLLEYIDNIPIDFEYSTAVELSFAGNNGQLRSLVQFMASSGKFRFNLATKEINLSGNLVQAPYISFELCIVENNSYSIRLSIDGHSIYNYLY